MTRPNYLALTHAAAASLALLTVALFWAATLIVELTGTAAQIALVKRGIVWGLAVLVPSMIAAVASGRTLVGPSPRGLPARKLRRMRVIGPLGLLVLVPAALVLAHWAQAGRFDTAFVAVQTVELVAGAVNLTLLGMNFRDGLRLRAARSRAQRHAATTPVARAASGERAA
jgi:hypothetical protein